jgi:hypothetical protein
LALALAVVGSVASGQSLEVVAARKQLERTVSEADSWSATATCPDLTEKLRTILNLQLRDMLGRFSSTPPDVTVDHLLLRQQGGSLDMGVQTSGAPDGVAKSVDREGTRWLNTSTPGKMLREVILQPLGLPTFGRGKALQKARVTVREQGRSYVDILIAPQAGNGTNILGKTVQTITVRIAKADATVTIFRAEFTDGATLQMDYSHEQVKAKDGTVFPVPSKVVVQQRGMGRLAQSVRLPAKMTITYADFVIEEPSSN